MESLASGPGRPDQRGGSGPLPVAPAKGRTAQLPESAAAGGQAAQSEQLKAAADPVEGRATDSGAAGASPAAAAAAARAEQSAAPPLPSTLQQQQAASAPASAPQAAAPVEAEGVTPPVSPPASRLRQVPPVFGPTVELSSPCCDDGAQAITSTPPGADDAPPPPLQRPLPGAGHVPAAPWLAPKAETLGCKAGGDAAADSDALPALVFAVRAADPTVLFDDAPAGAVNSMQAVMGTPPGEPAAGASPSGSAQQLQPHAAAAQVTPAHAENAAPVGAVRALGPTVLFDDSLVPEDDGMEGIEESHMPAHALPQRQSPPPGFCGLQTASGKPVAASAAAMQRARSLLNDDAEPAHRPESPPPGFAVGLHTASGKPVAISPRSLLRAEAMLGGADAADAAAVATPPDSELALSPAAALQTAGGKPVRVSEEAQRQVAARLPGASAAAPAVAEFRSPLLAGAARRSGGAAASGNVSVQRRPAAQSSGARSPALPGASRGAQKAFTSLRPLNTAANSPVAGSGPAALKAQPFPGVKPVLGRTARKTPAATRSRAPPVSL